MTDTYLHIFASVGAVSLVSLAGIASLSLRETFLSRYIFLFVSLAVGALLGDAFIHIIPEAFQSSIGVLPVSMLIICGILFFLTLEKFMHWHHHGEDHVHPVGKLVLISDGVHNFLDGLIIGVSFLVSAPIGIATTLAVILHEIPQEIGDFAVLVHAGYSRQRALWLNFVSALAAVLGAILAVILGEAGEAFSLWVLPVAAGGFIYIALADLIPELHKRKDNLLQIAMVIVGILAMTALVFLE